jgi:PHS family inorganic phosphate transporter-like MFS transporter
MQIFAVFMFAGIFTSLLIPETKRKTLEELCGELYGEGILNEERALAAAAKTSPAAEPSPVETGTAEK